MSSGVRVSLREKFSGFSPRGARRILLERVSRILFERVPRLLFERGVLVYRQEGCSGAYARGVFGWWGGACVRGRPSKVKGAFGVA
ncbi:MAG TPA: hypothetical protein VFV01_18900, partial [Spirillospora sp.]|nr:hypothetical protein [Spirillospora sp.]